MRRAIVLLALLGAACGAGGDGATLTVFAASSLTDAFTRIGDEFTASHDEVDIVFNFGASPDLAAQIESEGTADVFASASGSAMDIVAADPGTEAMVVFATNRLVVVTPADNPADIDDLADLANEGVQVVLGAEGVPVGDYAREVLANAGIADAVLANVVSNEDDNASVVAKVDSGEADAGIVYASDVSASAGNELDAIQVPDDINVIATYPIGVVSGSTNGELAAAFIASVTGERGQDVLAEYGFGPPG